MKRVFIFSIVLTVFFGCNQNETDNECILERIDSFGSEICNSGATVKRYTFQGNTVYAIHPGNCIADGADDILDADCVVLGIVGGFGGLTDINGENFYDNAVLEETIWNN